MQKICPYMDKFFWAIFAIKLGKIGIFEQNVGSRCPCCQENNFPDNPYPLIKGVEVHPLN